MENNVVVLRKYETIEKCLNRISEEYEDDPNNLEDYRKMDMIILNLQTLQSKLILLTICLMQQLILML